MNRRTEVTVAVNINDLTLAELEDFVATAHEHSLSDDTQVRLRGIQLSCTTGDE